MRRGSIFIGLLLHAGVTIAAISGAASLGFEDIATGALFFVGAAQLVWAVPLCLALFLTGRTQTLKGVLILAGIIGLLNAGCWGLLLTSPSGYQLKG